MTKRQFNPVLDAVAKWGLNHGKFFTSRDIPVELLQGKDASSILTKVRCAARFKTVSKRTRIVASDGILRNGIATLVVEIRPLQNVAGVAQAVRGTACNGTGMVVEYPSIQDAKAGGFTPTSIRYCLQGRLKTHGGFRWERVKS